MTVKEAAAEGGGAVAEQVLWLRDGRTVLHAVGRRGGELPAGAVERLTAGLQGQLLGRLLRSADDQRGWVPAHEAAVHGSTEALRHFLALWPAAAAATDRHGRTPLHLACSVGQAAAVELLLNHPACEPSAVDAWGLSALHMAVEGGHRDVAGALVRRHPELLGMCSAEGASVLHMAAAFGQPEMARWLLRAHPVLAERRDSLGRNAAHVACAEGQLEATEALFEEAPLLFNGPDDRKLLPIDHASAFGHLRIRQRIVQLAVTTAFSCPPQWLDSLADPQERSKDHSTTDE